jgi:drug/metabolite transporter (DMT)-like permease
MSTHVSTPARTNVVVPIIFVVIGVVLLVLAQFFLDHLADTSDTWHNIQHATFFVGGLGVGIGGTLLWASGQRG